MKRKGLIITNAFYFNDNNTHKAERFTEEFFQRGITMETKDAVSLLPITDGDKTYLDFSDYDFAIDLDKDSYLAKAVSMSIPMINSFDSLMDSDDKYMTILKMKDSGVRCPLTIPAPLCYTKTPDENSLNRFMDELEKRLSYPMVHKLSHGSLGKQVSLIHDREELRQSFVENVSTFHFYEEFLSLHQGHDYRLIVIGEEVVACMERINEHDFRSNIALGGKGYDATDKIPQTYKEMAIKACKVLGLDYAGIDIGTDNDGNPCFLEANGNAFFTEIEKVTGKNIASKFVDLVMKRIYGE